MVKERLYRIEVVPRCLTFKRPAGTSRGVYTTRKLWEVRIRKALEPILSRNIIKLQITDNHILSKV